MKPAIKWGIAAVSGIALFAALKKMSDANAEETARTQAELKQTREQIEAMQANNAIAASTATPATSDYFVILPHLIWQKLSGSTGDNVKNKQALLAWILANVPQECIFTGIYKPDFTKVIRGYKYVTNNDLTKCYIGVIVWSISHPGLIKTFGLKQGEYFENQIGG